ncbi:MAG: ribosomal protein L29 [Natronomonas sp.]|jgi:ribosomal protein L29
MTEEFPEELPDDIPEEHADRARELQMQLLALRAQLESANFENEEAYRRRINGKEGELESLTER